MLSSNSPVTFNDPLPRSVDVVIIGAGVIGISIAWFLAQRGVRAAVCEKGRVAGEQSSRNWGWIRQHGRDAAELPIMMESIDLWESMAREIPEDIGFQRSGVLYLAKDEAELAKRERWLGVARPHNLDTRMVTAKEIEQLIKGNPGKWIGGAYTASDARAEPFVAVPALARAVQGPGVRIIEACAVRALDTAGGRVSGVVTEKGPIRCNSVVCAGGAWAAMFARNLGHDFPLLTVRATVARTARAPEISSTNAASSRLAFRRRQDGGYTVAAVGFFDHFVNRDSLRHMRKFLSCFAASRKHLHLRFDGGTLRRLMEPPKWGADEVSPFETTRVLDPAPCPRAVAAINRRIARELPPLAGVHLEQTWAGMIDATPDLVPVMDEVAAIPGFYLAAGFCGHGFGIGPGVGRVMADMILGNAPGHDMTRFRFPRFTDGNKLELGPAI